MSRPKYLTSQAIWAITGFVVAAVLILGIRFFTYHPEHVHYHANFQVFINGQREQFADPGLYEESAASCSNSKEEVMTPGERSHMHDNINDVVHVEDHAVTWGQFFTNLGWVVDAKVIATPSQTLLPDNDHKISFTLNGQTMDNVSNRVIGDQDKLLVDYGDSDLAVKDEYAGISNKALKYDSSADPKSCGSGVAPTMHDRLNHML
jgi:hypothetical protein